MLHKDLECWKQSVDFVVEVYEITKLFPKEELFGLAQQMRRCAVSIPSNIAEGCSRKGYAETIQFLYIAIGSASELETQLIIANKLGYIPTIDHPLEKLTAIKKMLLSLTKYLKTHKSNKPPNY
ncbi:MAG: four helix bundle protein [Bacteroidales bacterium]|nr:four helix bundle protein [Bacteroidales bacterium]